MSLSANLFSRGVREVTTSVTVAAVSLTFRDADLPSAFDVAVAVALGALAAVIMWGFGNWITHPERQDGKAMWLFYLGQTMLWVKIVTAAAVILMHNPTAGALAVAMILREVFALVHMRVDRNRWIAAAPRQATAPPTRDEIVILARAIGSRR